MLCKMHYTRRKAMKYLTIAILLGIGTITAGADDVFSSKKFVGIELGATSLQGDIGGILSVPNNTVDSVEYGLRVGAQNETWRTTLALDFFDKDEQNTEKFLGAFDYFFNRDPDTPSGTIEPYFGLNVGYVNYESTGIDESGLLYGGQIGAVLNMFDEVDIDLSYRYSLSSVDSFDHSGSVMVGLNYFY